MGKKKMELYYQLPRNIGLEELSDEEAGKVWKALDRYQGERERMPNAVMRLVYKTCCDHIDCENERYEAFCEKQREKSRRQKAWIEKHGDELQCTPRSSMELSESESQSETQSQSQSESKSESESQSERERETCVREDEFKSELLLNQMWQETQAMTWHLTIDEVRQGIEMADSAFVSDMQYPQDFQNYAVRVRQYISAHWKDIKKLNNQPKTTDNEYRETSEEIIKRLLS